MNIDQYESRMISALEGELTSSDYEVLINEIDTNEDLKAIWSSYQELYDAIGSVPKEIPGENVKDRFTDWLDEYADNNAGSIAPKGVKKGPILLWRKWASVAAVFICLFGFWKFYEHNRKMESTLADVSYQMKSLMEQQSSTARIKAIRVNYSPEVATVDEKMIQVLVDVLNQDQSSNVRLAAVETLANYIDQEIVREALINRLKEERDGSVKLSIITSLGQLQNENLKTTLENIVNDDSQEKFVIDEAHMQLIRFERVDI